MQDDDERENGPEEGEYHFSDEGVYETNSEEAEGKSSELIEKKGFGTSLKAYQRLVILGGGFAGVLLVVYLFVSPPVTVPPTEITQETVSSPPPESSAAVLSEAVPANQNAVTSAETGNNPPAATEKKPSILHKVLSSVPAEAKKTEAFLERQPSQTANAPVLTNTPPPPPVSSNGVASAPAPAASSPAQEMTVPVQSSALLTPPAPQPTVLQSPLPTSDRMVIDRLIALEETHTKMISQLNADYAHKLAAFETQDRVLQEQVRSLTTKISGMEAQMTQLVQTLNKQQMAQSASPSNERAASENSSENNNPTFTLPGSEVMSPAKATYSVQAIIPGRAWLRTDSGDTVTVAEGDSLKGMGRVMKIDPYDGTIQIDTGTKVITLTYGNGDYT